MTFYGGLAVIALDFRPGTKNFRKRSFFQGMGGKSPALGEKDCQTHHSVPTLAFQAESAAPSKVIT